MNVSWTCHGHKRVFTFRVNSCPVLPQPSLLLLHARGQARLMEALQFRIILQSWALWPENQMKMDSKWYEASDKTPTTRPLPL